MAEIKIHHASEVDNDEWRQLQALQRNAFAISLDRDLAEIDALVDWDDPARFIASHLDPNTEVGKRFNADQLFTKPKVAVATLGGEAVGFAYSAHNVSGATEEIRNRKRLTVVKNYLWMREIAVSDGHRREGIASALGKKLLWHAIPVQPVTAYIWPDEMPYMQGTLENLGFKATGDEPVTVFGEGSDPVTQVRMQAPTAFGVLRKL